MSDKIKGGCACGQVRYEFDTEPAFVGHCHCKDCQKASGGQMATVAAFARNAFHLTKGEAKSYHYDGDSGMGLDRFFCPNCGSRLYSSNCGAMPEMMFVAVGSLDEPQNAKPMMHIFTKSKQPWAAIDDGLPSFETMPS